MKKLLHLQAFFLFLLIALVNAASAQTINDHIFPPSATAKTAIDYDARGFIINGKRVFVVSAGLEYARIPHQLWADRLLRLKRDGFNCIEIYTFWNFHEPQDGVFDFSGDHDLDAFLKLVKSFNMYAVVRVGPYYCAEWDSGGYPIWLRFKEGLSVREPNVVFEKYTDRFFDHLIPIVSQNQINHSGAVILVQLENEHTQGWGTIEPNEYFTHLQNKALSLGLEVPYFFSGLHHGGDPAGNASSFDDANRPNPWFTTEFWSVWFSVYGSGQKDADTYERRTWKIIAHGGNGYNFYMAHGGSNFGYTNNNEDAASYDYGAAVGQTGDLRQMYYQLKHNAFFARTFQDILENSLDAGTAYKKFATDSTLKINGRRSDKGDIVFVDNQGKAPVATQFNIDNAQLPLNNKLTLAPGEILPVVHGYGLAPGIELDWAVTRILGASKQGNTTTLVVYGDPKSAAYLQFTTDGAVKVLKGANSFTAAGKKLSLNILFDDQNPVTYVFKIKDQTVRVLTVNTKLAERTWFVDEQKKNYVVTGPEYVGRVTSANNNIQIETEHFWEQKSIYPTWIFGEGLSKTSISETQSQPAHEEELPLGAVWKVKDAGGAAKTDFDDHNWLKSKGAPQMGADGDLSADAWYRTSVNIAEAGPYVLKIKKGGDRATVFVDGVRAASGNIHNNELKINLAAGAHNLAIFTAHDGRDKLFGYMGPIHEIAAKGLMDEVVLQKSMKGDYLTGWKMKPGSQADFRRPPPAFTDGTAYNIGDDAFGNKPGFEWFQAALEAPKDHMPSTLEFGGIDDNAVVFVNGKRVLRQNGYNIPFSVALDGLLKPDSINLISLLIQNTDGSGGISKAVEIEYDDKTRIMLSNWSMKGGPGAPDAIEGWRDLKPADSFDRPAFFKNTFTVSSLNTNSNGMYRVGFNGLGHGSVWVNGYNIGRYPEKIPVKSMYIPECWLKNGTNSIVIFDEDGNTPGKVEISAEKAASRDVQTVKF